VTSVLLLALLMLAQPMSRNCKAPVPLAENSLRNSCASIFSHFMTKNISSGPPAHVLRVLLLVLVFRHPTCGNGPTGTIFF
jgi:hypothetical protein